MKAKVYVETTIPSFYYDIRTEAHMVARQQWTRLWWDNLRGNYLVVTSVAVLDELSHGNYPNKDKAIKLASHLPLLPVDASISHIVQAYIRHKVMPNDPVGDALHLALASYHKCYFLLTWNCRHLANANKFGQTCEWNAWLVCATACHPVRTNRSVR